MGDDVEHYAEIVPFSGDLKDEGYRCMGPMSKRLAEKVCNGADINLDHEAYFTRARPVDEPAPELAEAVVVPVS